MNENSAGSLRVSAHVLVQLGEELVTDSEQAILECVKNAYDADSPGCTVIVNTAASGQLRFSDSAERLLKFNRPAENVSVSFLDEEGEPYQSSKSNRHRTSVAEVTRTLDWRGSVVVEDHGDGLSETQVRESWLVISGSSKRAQDGKKGKTTKGRTPLGDKGVGRLGSMKLGDILLVESAQSETAPVVSAEFRWADCEVALTVDQIPVVIRSTRNVKRFKGTRVSILGLRDAEQWAGNTRAAEVTKSLARLISPFEAQSKFPVVVDVDGHKQTLVAVTDTLLARAIARFDFEWTQPPGEDGSRLKCTARFKERLFRSTGSSRQGEKEEAVFGSDDGTDFLRWLKESRRGQRYEITPRPEKAWFVQLEQDFDWKNLLPDSDSPIENPGELLGSIYYFHLNDLTGDIEADEANADLDLEAAAGIGIDKELVKDMAGISILRDGFRIRSSGDWLNISEGMTTGSTYGLRFQNTIGYFSLTGEHNYKLVEKSDREGFVENAPFRGFMAIAEACKKFANESLESVRRGQDVYAGQKNKAPQGAPRSSAQSLEAMQKTVNTANLVKQDTDVLLKDLRSGLDLIEGQLRSGKGMTANVTGALQPIKSAIAKAEKIQKDLAAPTHAAVALKVVRDELADNKERMLSLYESAAVGLSARGLAHDLRTHIVEIRKRCSALETLIKSGHANPTVALPHLRAIRSSCSTLAGAASLIDPLLPRTRAVKESIDLAKFFRQYFEDRASGLEAEEITVKVRELEGATIVRMNRGRLLSIFDNLMRNSVYWLRRGVDVLGIERDKEIRVTVTAEGFTIADSGPGVDPAYEASIFEIFTSAKPATDRGQGLGLFIITQLLAADGCSIHLAPDKNKDGRKFKFVVNLASVIEGD